MRAGASMRTVRCELPGSYAPNGDGTTSPLPYQGPQGGGGGVKSCPRVFTHLSRSIPEHWEQTQVGDDTTNHSLLPEGKTLFQHLQHRGPRALSVKLSGGGGGGRSHGPCPDLPIPAPGNTGQGTRSMRGIQCPRVEAGIHRVPDILLE